MKILRPFSLPFFLLLFDFFQHLLSYIHAAPTSYTMKKNLQEVCEDFKISSENAILTDRNRKTIDLSLPLRYTPLSSGGGTLTISHLSNSAANFKTSRETASSSSSILNSSFIPEKYLSFLEKNHIKHHRSKGTKYFNIRIFSIFDI